MRRGRDEWQERVRGWAASGLTAREYASKHGLRAGTLAWWRWKLEHDRSQNPTAPKAAAAARGVGGQRRRAAQADPLTGIIELRANPALDGRFEIALASGQRVFVPGRFDEESLRRLLAILEEGA